MEWIVRVLIAFFSFWFGMTVMGLCVMAKRMDHNELERWSQKGEKPYIADEKE